MIESFRVPKDFDRKYWALWNNEPVEVRVIGMGRDERTKETMFRVKSTKYKIDFAVGRDGLWESEQAASAAIADKFSRQRKE